MSSPKIYKITSPNGPQVYIGSTSINLNQRFAKHKTSYARHTSGTFVQYYSSFEVLKLGSPRIELVEDCTGLTNQELLERERFHMSTTANCVNIYAPHNNSEKYKRNRDSIRAYHSQWRTENSHRFTATKCDCGGKYSQETKSQHLRTKKHMNHVNPPPSTQPSTQPPPSTQ